MDNAESSPQPDSPPQSDQAKRRQLEAELSKLGMSTDEVRRLLNANAETTQAMRPPASPALSTPPPSPMRQTSIDSLQAYAATLTASKSAAQQQAVSSAAEELPPFRESSVQEVRAAEALLREAHMLRKRELYKDAEAKCREALKLVPKDAAALEFLGDLQQGVARIDAALAAYKRAVEADPKRASAEKKYADLLMRQQNWGSYDPEAVEKNPFFAVLLSALLPGTGQFYNGEIPKGVFFLVLGMVCVYLLAWSPWGFSGERVHGGITMGLIAITVLTAIVYGAGLIDAQVTAKRGNSR